MRCPTLRTWLALWTLTACAATVAAQQPSRMPLPPATPRPEALPSDETIPAQPIAPMPEDTQPGFTLAEAEFMAQTSNPALREASAKVAAAQGQAIQVGLCPNPIFFTSSPQLAGSSSQYNWVLGQDFITANKLGLNRGV